MKHTIVILLMLIVLTFVGCQSTDIVELPHQEPKLVLNCVSFNDHIWQARISASQDVLDMTQFTQIKNAVAKLYENGNYIETLKMFVPDNGWISDGYYFEDGVLYQSVTTPKVGNVYKMTVEVPGYTMIESEFRQPDPVSATVFDIKVLGPSTRQGVPPGTKDTQVTIGFNDPPGENYYELNLVTRAELAPNYIMSGQAALQFIDPAYKENNEIFIYGTMAFDDRYFDGKPVKFDFMSMQYGSVDGYQPEEYEYTVFVRNITKEYFLYLKTTSLQRKTAADPFAQPVLLSNNITNGYGIFGGYTQTTEKRVVPNN